MIRAPKIDSSLARQTPAWSPTTPTETSGGELPPRRTGAALANGQSQIADSRAAGKQIPIHFISGRVAVNEECAIEMLGLNDGRTERAKKKAFYRFCAEHDIKPLPGRVFSVTKIEAACAA